MKTTHFPYRTFIWVMQVMLSLSAITGTTYRGDLPRSPLSRFLYSLHSSKNTSRSSFRHPPGTTYSFCVFDPGTCQYPCHQSEQRHTTRKYLVDQDRRKRPIQQQRQSWRIESFCLFRTKLHRGRGSYRRTGRHIAICIGDADQIREGEFPK